MKGASFCLVHSSWYCPCVKPKLYTPQEKRDYLAGITSGKKATKKVNE
jgi:hypothetical protein